MAASVPGVVPGAMLSVPSPFIVIAPDAGAVPVARPRAEPSAAVVVFNVTFVPITALPVPPLASSLPSTEGVAPPDAPLIGMPV